MTFLPDYFDPTNDPLFCDLIDAVGECFIDDDSHGMSHALNTLDFAMAIAAGLKERKGGDIDLFVLAAAALMHDIGRENIFSDPRHGERGARRAGDILKKLGAPWDREKIMHLIALHDERDIDEKSAPIELIILRDADKLELLRIGPDYLDLDRLATKEALALVGEVLARYDTGETGYREKADETVRRANELLAERARGAVL